MSAQLTFWYKRRQVVEGKDGTKIIVECEDMINLYDVVRGWWSDDNTFLLQMNDGHEESIEKQYFQHPEQDKAHKDELRKRKVDIPKERRYILSYLELHGIDIFRYRTATELMVPTDLDALSKVQQPVILNPPRPKIEVTQTSVDDEGKTDQKAASPMSIVKDDPEELPSVLPKEEIGDPMDAPIQIKEESEEKSEEESIEV